MDSCETIQDLLLELDADAVQRQRIGEALRHLDECPLCAAALKDFDRIRSAMMAKAPGYPSGGWPAMEERLTFAIRRGRPRRDSHVLRFAAAVLIALTGFVCGAWVTNTTLRRNTETNSNGVATDSTVIPYPSNERTLQATAFDQVSQVYDHRAAWMLLGDSTSDIGIRDSAIAPQHDLIVMRLTLLQSGEVVSQADMAILPGQSARLSFAGQRGIQLEYHINTSSDRPMLVAIWTRVIAGGDQSYGALATTCDPQSPGVALRELVTHMGSFQLKVSLGSERFPSQKQGP